MHPIVQEFLIDNVKNPIPGELSEREFKLLAPDLFKIYKENINEIFRCHYEFIYSDLELKYLPHHSRENSLTKLIFESCKYGKLYGTKELNMVLDDILQIFLNHDKCFNSSNSIEYQIYTWEKYKLPFVSWINAGETLLTKHLLSKSDNKPILKTQKLIFNNLPADIQLTNYEFHTLIKKVSVQDILILLAILKCTNEHLKKRYR